jgi:hypothetical protein
MDFRHRLTHASVTQKQQLSKDGFTEVVRRASIDDADGGAIGHDSPSGADLGM